MLETIFQYRALVGKCTLGVGLEWEEIEQITEIETLFAPAPEEKLRRFRREPAAIRALLRGDRIHDNVDVVEVGLGGLVVRNAPYVARGERVELVVEHGDFSYRFCAQGAWLKDDGDDYRLGLAFVGMPVRLRRTVVAKRASEPSIVDRIALAA